MSSYDSQYGIGDEEDVPAEYFTAGPQDLNEHQKPSRLRNRRQKQNKQPHVKHKSHGKRGQPSHGYYDDSWE